MNIPSQEMAGDKRESFRPQIENLVRGLFAPNDQPFFDSGVVSPALLEEFIQSDEVFDAAFAFAVAMMQIWTKRTGKKLKGGTRLRQANPRLESMVSPEVSASDSVDPADTRILTQPTASFHIPNAKAGQSYAGKIEGTDSSGAPVRVRDVRLPSKLVGLEVYDDVELRGVPVVGGDYKISLQWTADRTSWVSGECLLIVNPDPRSLWKKVDPPADDPYFKTNTDGTTVDGDGFRIAAASRRGRSHEHAGTFRDDDFFVHHDADSGWSVLIVADGAGSAKNSRWGSKLAAEVAGRHLVSSLSGDFGARMDTAISEWDEEPAVAGKVVGDEFHYLFHKMGSLAVQAIDAEAQAKGMPAKDYATTLLAAVSKRQGSETFLASFWLGDGAIAAYGPQGKVRLMGTPDGGDFAGQTRFLDRAAMTDHAFGKRVGVGRYTDLCAVFLMTDGISDPRFETDNGLIDARKWDALWEEMSPFLASPEPEKALIQWLDFFAPGHHDDRTIAVLYACVS
ncbi:MAG: PP2C family serine/threonine-protein phosphatase [Candidatus Accumulibacter phosphatis]|jgi:hypothetical protein|uniref:PPM-type phosphatase domain-containing protein n=2 Tax=Candidatus Accumulibacter TaxID=327159 RepID=A0A080M5Q4_9PROT|nr:MULTISPECIES: PP2C family serine/threonine-protein phosphatase [Candidatus Accumulibacter]KFB72399.1 MAG: hypothetical protein AW09_002409 [Candidatus Accumulibacter phosphatis]MBL8406224.1 protein phosphatase 2C domain-containing protein [Accumulibacter sp.]HRF10916.1 PP2C family serine/threonine-protein phosphatase [Candidatus Accumulibacter phosphatis]